MLGARAGLLHRHQSSFLLHSMYRIEKVVTRGADLASKQRERRWESGRWRASVVNKGEFEHRVEGIW